MLFDGRAGRSHSEQAGNVTKWPRHSHAGATQQAGFLASNAASTVPVPVEALSTDRAVEDAWVLVPTSFWLPQPIGGWSAAEHWDLTEQIFRDVCVLQLADPFPNVTRWCTTSLSS